MGFRASTPNCWARVKGKNLTKDAYILALFVELYPAAHYSGLYSLPLIDIQENTGLAEGEISEAMNELERAGIAIFDRSRMIVYVPGMMLRQLGVGKINAKQKKGILAHLEGFSKSSPTVPAFLKDYGLTLPDTLPDTPIAYPHGIPVSDRGMAYNLNLRPEPEPEKRDLRPTGNDTLPIAPLEGASDRAPGEGEVDDPKIRAATLKMIRDASRKIGGDDSNGSGKGKISNPTLDFLDTLTPPKRDALKTAIEKFHAKVWSRDQVEQHLADASFEEAEFLQSDHFFAGSEVTG